MKKSLTCHTLTNTEVKSTYTPTHKPPLHSPTHVSITSHVCERNVPTLTNTDVKRDCQSHTPKPTHTSLSLTHSPTSSPTTTRILSTHLPTTPTVCERNVFQKNCTSHNLTNKEVICTPTHQPIHSPSPHSLIPPTLTHTTLPTLTPVPTTETVCENDLLKKSFTCHTLTNTEVKSASTPTHKPPTHKSRLHTPSPVHITHTPYSTYLPTPNIPILTPTQPLDPLLQYRRYPPPPPPQSSIPSLVPPTFHTGPVFPPPIMGFLLHLILMGLQNFHLMNNSLPHSVHKVRTGLARA